MTEQLFADAGVGGIRKDVFEAARWFDGGWNSTAKAVTADLIEWKCTTWGSGRGAGSWEEVGTFVLVAQVFGLATGRDRDDREFPWRCFLRSLRCSSGSVTLRGTGLGCGEDEVDAQIAVAAGVLGVPVEDVAGDDDLLEALRIEC